jgi:hypothetical protein
MVAAEARRRRGVVACSMVMEHHPQTLAQLSPDYLTTEHLHRSFWYCFPTI